LLPVCTEMVVAVPVYGSRVAPLLDAARQVVAVRFRASEEVGRFTVELVGLSAPERVVRLSERGIDAVVCAGLCAHTLKMLEMFGIQVVWGVVGEIEQVLQAFRAGTLDQPRFYMPGCRRARRRMGWGRGRR
jgi:predicted Fe-Mo cluster-binding NifX family protein